MKSTFANRSARDARRVNFAVQIAGSLNPNVSTATLTSYCQMQRFNLLAAIGMSASQPVLKAAFVLRNDAPTIENLRRAFPYQQRLLKIVIKLRIPGYSATHSDSIWPPKPEYPATCGALR